MEGRVRRRSPLIIGLGVAAVAILAFLTYEALRTPDAVPLASQPVAQATPEAVRATFEDPLGDLQDGLGRPVDGPGYLDIYALHVRVTTTLFEAVLQVDGVPPPLNAAAQEVSYVVEFSRATAEESGLATFGLTWEKDGASGYRAALRGPLPRPLHEEFPGTVAVDLGSITWQLPIASLGDLESIALRRAVAWQPGYPEASDALLGGARLVLR